MFDEILRELRKLQRGVQVPISIEVDEDGYWDRSCPSQNCGATFKVLLDDWEKKVRDVEVYCPICRHAAPASEWDTTSQQKQIEDTAFAYLSRRIDNALGQDAARFNRQQPKGGFLQVSMHYSPGAPVIVIPAQAGDAMRQKFVCEHCGCRYAAIGPAFFCPACGHNSAVSTFRAAMETVRQTVASMSAIHQAVEQVSSKDSAAHSVGQIVENTFCGVVGSFQRFAEAAFARLTSAGPLKVRKNAFQNLREGSDLWQQATGQTYASLIPPAELTELNRYFQQRHLLAHRNGIVDQEYIDKAGDRSYSIGQRLVVRGPAVLRFAELVSNLAEALRKLLP